MYVCTCEYVYVYVYEFMNSWIHEYIIFWLWSYEYNTWTYVCINIDCLNIWIYEHMIICIHTYLFIFTHVQNTIPIRKLDSVDFTKGLLWQHALALFNNMPRGLRDKVCYNSTIASMPWRGGFMKHVLGVWPTNSYFTL